MYKKTLCAVTILFSFIFSQLTFADSWGCGEGMKKMVESMKLDDAQKAKIKPIFEQLKTSMKQNVTQMRDLEKQINQQAESATVDQAKVDGLISNKVSIIGIMMKAKFKAKMEILSILTPQQKTELQTKMKKLEEKVSEQYKKCHEQD